jgi:hypothetical protein
LAAAAMNQFGAVSPAKSSGYRSVPSGFVTEARHPWLYAVRYVPRLRQSSPVGHPLVWFILLD